MDLFGRLLLRLHIILITLWLLVVEAVVLLHMAQVAEQAEAGAVQVDLLPLVVLPLLPAQHTPSQSVQAVRLRELEDQAHTSMETPVIIQ
jgi:hypothetical protein